MRSRIRLYVAGLLGVTLASFWIALRSLDYWSSPGFDRTAVSAPNFIHIAEATYGLNCRGFVVPPGHVNQVKEGNATDAIAKICEKAIDNCNFYFDVADVGDPAPGCSKDLTIGWRCAADDKVRRLHIAQEAYAKPVSVTCLGR
jgi:hypothetical protein